MNGLWIGIAALALLALVFVFFPFVRARKATRETAKDRKQQNIEIFKDRVSELDQELEAGTLDKDAYLQLKTELEKNLLGDVVEQDRSAVTQVGGRQLLTVSLLALITVSAAMGLYYKLGSHEALAIAEQRAEMRKDGRTPTLEEAIASLKDELKIRPDNPEGWYMLATTYLNMGEYQQGADALGKVLDTLPADAPQYPSVMGQYAQAAYFAAGSRMTPEIRKHIDRTLKLAPTEVTTLGLLGIDAFEQQNYQQALDFWQRALANAQGEAQRSLEAGIQRAREALQAQGVELAPAKTASAGAVSLRVQVSLSDELKARVKADQTVFVFARPVGGRMPLAAVRLTASQLPTEVVLDDSLAMMPEMKLSSVDEVEVNAKVSMSGRPQASPGDLFGSIAPVTVIGQKGTLTLVIDQVVQ